MSLETATYISDLNPLNPVHADGLNQADGHLRTLKSALKTTFPNVTGAVTATHTDLNTTAGLVSGTVITSKAAGTVGGSVVLKGAPTGTYPDSSIVNFQGRFYVANSSGVGVMSVAQTGDIVSIGAINAPSIQKNGNELIPTGIIAMWSGLTTNVPAGWHLCDGTAGTPNLIGMFIVGAGPGGPSVAQTGGTNVQTLTVSTAGAHSHGGATGAAGGHGHSGVTDAQGAHSHAGGTAGYALTINDIPAHDHGLGTVNLIGQGVGGNTLGAGGVFNAVGPFVPQGGNAAHAHGIVVDGNHAHNVTAFAVADHAHGIALDGSHNHTVSVDVRPTYYAICLIMKL